MKIFNRVQSRESRRYHLKIARIFHKKVHPEGIEIVPEALGEWSKNRDDIKRCEFCGRWFWDYKPKKKTIFTHLDLKD